MNRATNAATMRASNRKLVLNLIRLKPISRVELAEQTRLTRASITQIVDELIAEGLVEAASVEARGTLGRRRTQLALRRDARLVFGVNIRRSRCYVGAIDLYGDVRSEARIPLAGKSVDQAASDIAAAIDAQIGELAVPRERLAGLGVCAPGPVDYRRGIILNPPNFAAWHGAEICARLREATGLAAALEKDTNARALEEKYFGAAQDISNFMLVQIDEGVGSGVMVDDKLYRGARGLGTEIGHTSIRFDGPVCGCGGRGCLENYLRIPALLQGSRFASWHELSEAAEADDAARLLDRAAEYLATALVNAINLYDLEKVLLTGDVSDGPDALLRRVNERVRARALTRSAAGETPVAAAGPAAPVRTGAMAALHELFQDRAG